MAHTDKQKTLITLINLNEKEKVYVWVNGDYYSRDEFNNKVMSFDDPLLLEIGDEMETTFQKFPFQFINHWLGLYEYHRMHFVTMYITDYRHQQYDPEYYPFAIGQAKRPVHNTEEDVAETDTEDEYYISY
jgi:hypothetical protein